MTSIRGTALKLLAFTLVTIAVTTWLAGVIGNFRLGSSPYEVTAEFTDATGLLDGDVVKAAGVTIGRVNDVEVRDGIALVTMAIDEGVEIPAGVGASIRFRNLIGQRMVVLEQRSAGGSALLTDGDRILLEETDPAFDLTLLFNGLRPLIRSTSPRDINVVARSVTEALRGRGDEIETILENLTGVADTLAARDRELSSMLTNLSVLTDDIAARDTQLRGTVGDLDTFLASVEASREDLSEALVTLNSAATRFGRILEANDHRIEGELADLSKVLDAVNDKRARLRGVVRALPNMLEATKRVNSYGQWTMIHLVDVCKDDTRSCGRQAR